MGSAISDVAWLGATLKGVGQRCVSDPLCGAGHLLGSHAQSGYPRRVRPACAFLVFASGGCISPSVLPLTTPHCGCGVVKGEPTPHDVACRPKV